MSVYCRELRAYRNSTVIWIMSLSLMLIVFLSIFPTFSNDIEETRKILANLPPFISSAIGVSIESIFSIYGFMSYLFTFVTVAGAVQAMNLGVGILSKEESGKTADFLLSKPISRRSVVTSKMLAAVSIITMTNIVFLVVALGMAGLVVPEGFDIGTFMLVSGKLILIQMIFLALGFLLSVLIRKIKSSIAVSLPVVFSFFILGTLGAVLDLEYIEYISPFKFFDSNYIIANNAYELTPLVIEAIFVLTAVVVSHVIFINKDIRSAS